MAAITPSNIQIESAGSLNLIVATFATITSGDTYASGLGKTVIATQMGTNSTPSTTATPFTFEAINASGTFTFFTGTGGTTTSATLLAWVRG
jgi:hypothetical protein